MSTLVVMKMVVLRPWRSGQQLHIGYQHEATFDAHLYEVAFIDQAS